MFFKKIFIFIYLFGCTRSQLWNGRSSVFTATCRLLIVACKIQFPPPGIESGSPALGAQSLSHWTTREVPELIFLKRKSLSHVQLFETPWAVQSMEFSRPEYWSGQPFPSPGDLPNPGIEPRSPTVCRRILYQLSYQGKVRFPLLKRENLNMKLRNLPSQTFSELKFGLPYLTQISRGYRI